MFRLNRTIIRPNTKHSIGTFSERLHYGIPYCLQIVLTLQVILVLLADVCQGCCIFLTRFKIYVRKALEEWKRKYSGMGIPLENTTLYTLQFADDQVVLAGEKEDLECMTRKLTFWHRNFTFKF